jgi:Cadherin-like
VNASQGTLSISPPAGITFIAGGSTGQTLSMEGTRSALEQALNNILFTANFGAKGPAPINVTVIDVSNPSLLPLPQVSNAITIYVASPPAIGNIPPSITINEGKPTPTPIFPTALVSDYDGEPLTQLRFTYDPAILLAGSTEQIIFPTVFATPTLSPTYDNVNGIFTITGSASLVEYQTYIQQLAYQNLSLTPSAAPRTFTIEVFDGTHWSNIASTDVFVTSVNSIPSITVEPAMSLAYGQEINLALQSGATPLQIYDNDANTSMLELRIKVTSGLLRFDNTQNLAAMPNSASARSFFITGTLSQLNLALTQIYYKTDPGFSGSDTLSLSIDDFGGSGLPAGQSMGRASSTIFALPIVRPTAIFDSTVLTFTENDAGVRAFSDATVTSSNVGTIYSAKITIVSGYQIGSDILIGGGQWDASIGQLTIKGPIKVLDLQNLLRSVTYQNISDNPIIGKRELLVEIFDGLQTSIPQSRFINVVPINDAPVLTASATIQTAEDVAVPLLNFKIADVFDIDSAALSLSIQATHGGFIWSGGTQPSGVQLLANGAVKLTGSALDINSWSTQLSFNPEPNFNGVADVTWTLSDIEPVPLSVTKQSQISISAVNDTPTWQSSIGVSASQGNKVAVLSANSKAMDVEDTANKLTYQLTALPAHGQLLVGGVALTLSDQFTQADIDSGRVEYRHDGGSDTSDTIQLNIADSQGAKTGEKTITVAIKSRPVVVIAPPSTTPSSIAGGSTNSGAGSGGGLNAVVKDASATGGEGGSASSGTSTVAATVPASSTTPKSTSNASRSAPSSNSSNTAEGNAASNTAPTNASNDRINQVATLSIDKLPSATSASTSTSKENAATRQEGIGQAFRVRTEVENLQYAGIMRAALTDKGFFEDVQKNRDEVQKTIKLDRNVVASGTAVSAGLSIGYVIWLVRGGALMSSLLASIPAWRLMDPLPILGSMGDNEKDSDDESLDAMIEKSRAKKLAAVPLNSEAQSL